MKQVEVLIYFNTLIITIYILYIILGIASHYPEPKDKKKFIESQMYDYNYDNPLPPKYNWPEETEPIKSKSLHDLSGDHLKKH